MPKPATRKIDGPSLKEVIELVKLHPEKTADDFVTSFNCDRARVHHARSVLGLSQKRPFAKRRNGVKPPGLKTVRTSTLDAKDKRIAELEKEIANTKVNKRTEAAVGLLKAKLSNLREKIENKYLDYVLYAFFKCK